MRDIDLNRNHFNFFRCGVHSEAQGYTIEQDLSKDYPDCCAKLVRNERKFKRVDTIDASAVKISKFKGRVLNKKYESSTSKVEEPVISSTARPPVKSTERLEEEEEEEEEYVVMDSAEANEQPTDQFEE